MAPEDQVSYIFKHRTKFLNLRTKVRDLEDARRRLQQSVEAANRNGEVIFDDVQRWLTEVNEKISEQAATQLQEDEEKAAKRCFAGFCPDFKSRYHLSKKADREADAIAQLLIEKGVFNAVSYLPAVEAIDIIRPVKEYESFESRSGAFDGVMAALEDDAVSIIGVYGMGGVGKTTLVKEAFKQAKEKQLFDEVVLVAINQTPNMVNIQKEIAEKIGLTIAEESMDVRAARLRERLKKEKKVLVILDDIWMTLDLESLGIPSGDEHKGCKILMTSRRLEVLESMNSQPNISIETLKEDEAWILFKKMAGHIVETSCLQSTAVEVAKRCAGLPIAIATIAKALKRKKNLYEWKNALEQLKPSKINFRGISGAMYSAIEMSYKYLETEELKHTFLLCSIMAHNAAIQDLLKHCRGLGLFHGLDTIEKVRNRALTLVSELKDSSLLLAGSTPECFDMHDVVRDVAISIASRDHRWLALGKEDVFEEWSDEDTLRNCNLISFKHAKVSQLPDELECPNLTFFSIHGTVEVPDNFLKGMQRLKVMEFADMRFRSLPASIGSLETLSSLCLTGCGLEDIAILGKLGNLEILDLHGSRINMLPKEIGQLTRLKLLDLSECFRLQVISPNVLSKLSRLEELYLYYSFEAWEVEGNAKPRSKASLVELQHLSRLTTLEVHIPRVEAIPEDNLFLGKMERFKISVGDEVWHSGEMKISRMLRLKSNRSIHRLLSRKAESLDLDSLEDAESLDLDSLEDVRDDPDAESFERLRFIKVSKCNRLKNLFSFSIAKRLGGQCLTSLKVKECPKLKYVFTSSMIESLIQLKTLEVSECDEIQEIIEGILGGEGISSRIRVFPKLDSLELILLPKLNSFCGGFNPIDFPSLKSLRISSCSKHFNFLNEKSLVGLPQYLFNEKVILPVLEQLKIGSMYNLERLWPDLLVEHSFSRLTSIELRFCDQLLNVFPLSMLTRLQRLNNMRIYNCKSVEEIVSKTRPREPGNNSATSQSDVITFEFPNLTSLTLEELPNLKSIHHNKMHTINWPSLKEMKVGKCHKVEILLASQETSGHQPLFWVNESTFPNLHQLTLGWNAGIKEMIRNCRGQQQQQLLSPYFPNLKVVKLEEYPQQVTVLPSYMFQVLSLPNLQTLGISRSSFKEMMFQSEEGGEKNPAPLLLSPITELRLECVYGLLHLWKDKEEFPNLRILYVHTCSELKFNLVPSSISFRNLVTLKVWYSHGIIKLITHSTAKSLVQLKEMIIGQCNKMEEIIQGGYDDDGDEISFPQLNRLELLSLPKLQSFCSSGNYTFVFPSLEILLVHNCSKMKMFSQGDSNTPMLHKVRTDMRGGEERCEGSLNNAIQQRFRRKNIVEGVQNFMKDQGDSSTSNNE